MNEKDMERFLNNIQWFNDFFIDVRHIFEAISKNLVSKSLAISRVGSYYVKSQQVPKIPPYYEMELKGINFAIQFFAVFDPQMLANNQQAFKCKPSFVIVKHSRVDRPGWVADYGARVITNDRITQEVFAENVIMGKLIGGDANGTHFFAFQVPFEVFEEGQDINLAIEQHIVRVLRALPDFSQKEP